METREREGHLERLSAMFRERRFAEAMEYLTSLEPEERTRLSRLIVERGEKPIAEVG